MNNFGLKIISFQILSFNGLISLMIDFGQFTVLSLVKSKQI